MNYRIIVLLLLLTYVADPVNVHACTSLLVTKGASADGSVMITYTADAAGFCPRLKVFPATNYPEGTDIEVPATKDRPASSIKQVAQTYHVIGVEWDPGPDTHGGFWTKQGFINEFQVAITETTFGGREELVNPQGLINYPMLITFALQRAKTAREAIDVMVTLVEEYGYNDGGESISIADKEEAWVFEIVGTGNQSHDRNAAKTVWVAKKVPDGEISVHANQARIGEIPDTPDKGHCFYSKNIRSFAIEKGWYDPCSGKIFRFDEAYDEINAKSKRACATRVWSIFRKVAPSQALSKALSPDYHRGKPGAKPYPWSIKPDKKLSVADVFALKRDHYEGTDYDMTRGLDAEPYGLPLRWRPLYWKLKNKEHSTTQSLDKGDIEYSWERPISTQQTGFSVVTQSRSELPDTVGGLVWYGVDDSYLTCYFPLYCCITDVPKPFATGSVKKFSWDSAWWVTNLVSNYANLKFNRIAPEIVKVQQELEAEFLIQNSITSKDIADVEQIKQQMYQEMGTAGPPSLEFPRNLLTQRSVAAGDHVFARWKQLATEIFTKFNDGYIRGDNGSYPREGDPYPDTWLRRIVEERPEQFRVP